MTFKELSEGYSNSLYDYDISFPNNQNTEKGHFKKATKRKQEIQVKAGSLNGLEPIFMVSVN